MASSSGWPPASSSATVRWSWARASSKLRASIAGSVVVTLFLVGRLGESTESRRDEDTKPDPGDRDRRDQAGEDEEVNHVYSADGGSRLVDGGRQLSACHPHGQPRAGG